MRRFGQGESVTGGNSTKQIRFEFSLPHHSVITSLRLRKAGTDADTGRSGSRQVERLDTSLLRKVTALNIRRAVDRLVAGQDAPNFAQSTDYDLVADGGVRLAPKKVFGLALEEALGIIARPGHFSAGWSQPCFQLLSEAGFRIVPKHVGPASPESQSRGDTEIPGDPEERSWAEGSTSFRRHARLERRRDPAATAAKRLDVRVHNGGRLKCENDACHIDWYEIFPVPVAESVFEIHHSIPVASMSQDHRTSVADLKCLCASCHRAEHRRLALLDLPSA
jgi:5-methylcytosine-specific restriction protein A